LHKKCAMDRLELTKKHKEKLSIMCDDLFPEFETADIWSDEQMADNFVTFTSDKKDAPSHYFCCHWLELCIVHIPKRIAEATETVDSQEKHRFLIDMMMKRMLALNSHFIDHPEKHPVDYLYEMYKKTL